MRTGWYPRRRDILDFLDRGELSLLDSAIHDFLCLIADWTTGLAHASAEKIRALCPADISLHSIQRSLQRLEELHFIKRFRVPGRRGNYPVVVGHYFVRDAALTWWKVNCESTTDYKKIQYDHGTEMASLGQNPLTEVAIEPATELAPIKEVRPKNLKPKNKKEADNVRPLSPVSVSPKRANLKTRLAAKVATKGTLLDALNEFERTGWPAWWSAVEEGCAAVGYRLDTFNPQIERDFAGAVATVWEENAKRDIPRSTICSRVIDHCMAEGILWPTDFQEHRDKLLAEERHHANAL